MAAPKTVKEEYEIVAYPKLHHVRASIVQIVNRNAHVHQALELGLVLAGNGSVRIGETAFDIQKESLFFFNKLCVNAIFFKILAQKHSTIVI